VNPEAGGGRWGTLPWEKWSSCQLNIMYLIRRAMERHATERLATFSSMAANLFYVFRTFPASQFIHDFA